MNDHHDDEVEAGLRRTFAARGEDMAAADGAGWDPDASAGLLLSLSTSDRPGSPGRAGAARWRRRPALVAAASVLVAGIGAVGYGVAAAGGNDPTPVAATIDCQPLDDEAGSTEGSPEEDAVREAEAELLQVQAALDAEIQARADAVREAEAALAEAQAALEAEVQARLDALEEAEEGTGPAVAEADEPAEDACSTPPPPTTEVPPATTEPTPPTTEVPPATTEPTPPTTRP